MNLPYQPFVIDYPLLIDEAWRAGHDGQPAAYSDVNHFLWGIENEGKTIASVLRELGVEPPTPPPQVLPRLMITGEFFALPGEPWTMIQCSDFNLLQRFVNGEDIAPVLTQRREVGFNTLRVWTGLRPNASIGHIIPGAALYAAIPSFLAQCAAYGLYVELTGFTGPYAGMFDSPAAMVAHWEALIAAGTGATNLFLELVNEGNNGPNVGLPYDLLRRPNGILSCHGSNRADALGVQPNWDYGTYHSNDLYEWQRKVGHNAWELGHKAKPPCPWTSNENTRFPDKDDTLAHANDAAASAALLCAGACFHSVHGKNSTLWDGLELECARAWTAGARSVPLEFQRGRYKHRKDLEKPRILRAYERRLPDGRGHVVLIGT